MKFENYLLNLENPNTVRNRGVICLHGVSMILSNIYEDIKKISEGSVIKKINKELGIPYQTFYCWISGRNPIPISQVYSLLVLWAKLCNKNESNFTSVFNRIYDNNNGYSQNGERTVKLPRKMNKNLGYIMGFFQGDGHLRKKSMKEFQEYSLYFYESDKRLLDYLNELLYEEFGVKGNIYFQSDNKGSWYTLRLVSKPIYLFFKEVLGLKTGSKIRNVGVPDIIKTSSKGVQIYFIRGFFDAEGAVGETEKNPWLAIGQAAKYSPPEILVWVRDKLVENYVYLSKPSRTKNQEFFRIRTSKRENIRRFFKIVSSNHPKKIERFGTI